jgi:hypothetical protein
VGIALQKSSVLRHGRENCEIERFRPE